MTRSSEFDAIHAQVADYYSQKIREHAATPKGVDWNSAASQDLRFQQLFKLCDGDDSFSILDYGCGYGALADFLERKGLRFRYTGYDLSKEMISHARAAHRDPAVYRFLENSGDLRPVDYVMASGIFNVRLGVPDHVWLDYIFDTLNRLSVLALRAFAFNLLSKYSDTGHRRQDLYYADPLMLFDQCKRRFSSSVALLHDYPLYEFTMLVRKQD